MADAAAKGDEPLPEQLFQAAEWFVLLASGEAGNEDWERHRQWRQSDPRHEQAWLRAQAASQPLNSIPRHRAESAMRALSSLTRRAGSRRRQRRIATALAVMFGIGLAGWQGYRSSDWSADAVTAIGEQRELALADGTRLLLDTGSAIDIDYTGAGRLIHLRRGRLLVQTGHVGGDGQRTFAVATDDGRVTALGTRFTVAREPTHSAVQVLESRVSIRPGSAETATILSADEGARFDRRGIVARTATAPTAAAWSRGLLVANAMRLDAVLAELGRYRKGTIHCDPAVAGLTISGTFPLGDIDRALAALARTLPVVLEPDNAAGLHVRAK